MFGNAKRCSSASRPEQASSATPNAKPKPVPCRSVDSTPALVEILRQAVRRGNHNYPWFQRDKSWDKLRGDPEFQRIMSEVEGYWKHYAELFGSVQS